MTTTFEMLTASTAPRLAPFVALLTQSEQATAEDYYQAWLSVCSGVEYDAAADAFDFARNCVFANEADKSAIDAAECRYFIFDCGATPSDHKSAGDLLRAHWGDKDLRNYSY
ncbi:hypothetical protein [Vibrio fluvialis]|uniref:hypothetical protein n=1 Tax=Vibrio fluvialis TaxID=676 RepID=UPI001C9C28FF|nr:hypothetical protein [Vibrio fluvialis]MBY8156932.1 hypothetical protein [Vibrio fluvialis]MBY8271665.1 hypothetical protein [Vibrio fluvialis]MCG6369056.1 hypothetical protein [Vibrio fluvialis]MCG6376223.1 hypothetical protein [Vibrio fluvialis]